MSIAVQQQFVLHACERHAHATRCGPSPTHGRERVAPFVRGAHPVRAASTCRSYQMCHPRGPAPRQRRRRRGPRSGRTGRSLRLRNSQPPTRVRGLRATKSGPSTPPGPVVGWTPGWTGSDNEEPGRDRGQRARSPCTAPRCLRSQRRERRRHVARTARPATAGGLPSAHAGVGRVVRQARPRQDRVRQRQASCRARHDASESRTLCASGWR